MNKHLIIELELPVRVKKTVPSTWLFGGVFGNFLCLIRFFSPEPWSWLKSSPKWVNSEPLFSVWGKTSLWNQWVACWHSFQFPPPRKVDWGYCELSWEQGQVEDVASLDVTSCPQVPKMSLLTPFGYQHLPVNCFFLAWGRVTHLYPSAPDKTWIASRKRSEQTNPTNLYVDQWLEVT